MGRSGEPDEPREHRCTATAKGTGQRCRRWAVTGSTVCIMHGAGTRRRQSKAPRDGRLRKEPTSARLVHGLYATRLPRTVRAAAQAYEAAGEELYRLDAVAARLWVLLEQCDRMAEVARRDAAGRATPAAIAALGAVERVLTRLQGVIGLRDRLVHNRREMVTRGELLAVLRLVSVVVEELAMNESIPREEFRFRLVQRVTQCFGIGEPGDVPELGPELQ